jgi:hypothetical protein
MGTIAVAVPKYARNPRRLIGCIVFELVLLSRCNRLVSHDSLQRSRSHARIGQALPVGAAEILSSGGFRIRHEDARRAGDSRDSPPTLQDIGISAWTVQFLRVEYEVFPPLSRQLIQQKAEFGRFRY